jgi:glycine betaine/proline transport system permease protein
MMTANQSRVPENKPFVWQRPIFYIWSMALFAAVLFQLYGKPFAPWAFKFPRGWQTGLRYHLSDFSDWLLNDATFGLFTFTEMTRMIAWLMDIPYSIVKSFLATGLLKGQGSDAIQLLPPLSWIAVIFIVGAMGYYARGWRLATLVAGCFTYLAVFGQWDGAMITLSSIIIAVPFGILGGLFLGLAAHRWPMFSRIISPFLDIMQTVPVFAYLVPILVFFGFRPVSAIIATIIYAISPMVRITVLALKQVPSELSDLGDMVGCTRRQKTWKVMIPSAKASLMVGVNQVIMLSLNMVIIASMIGAGGLGFTVLAALRRLDIGAGLEAGFAIVVLAIALDRLSQGFARRTAPSHLKEKPANFFKRHPYTIVSLVVVVVTALTGLVWGFFQAWPEQWSITTGTAANQAMKYINIHYYDFLEGIKTSLLLNLMIPTKRFLLSLPWPVVIALLGLAGYSLKGWRLALLCMALAGFIVINGQWPKAMITVYLCGVSVILAALVGIPIGIMTSTRDRLWNFVKVVIDTLQTMPSLAYLMPVVMLFRVGDFTAMIAIIAYAITPAIRYTAVGLRQVDPNLVEAGIVAGCTPWQILTKIKLKLAIPQIMLGINQTVMLALSMLVITALVGTRDLGQEVYIGLTKADVGRGMVAGLSIAFIAIITDRLITAGADRLKTRLGLSA